MDIGIDIDIDIDINIDIDIHIDIDIDIDIDRYNRWVPILWCSLTGAKMFVTTKTKPKYNGSADLITVIYWHCFVVAFMSPVSVTLIIDIHIDIDIDVDIDIDIDIDIERYT